MHRIANLKLLLALALALRLGFLLLAGVNAPLTGDELAFQQIAVNVAAGRGFVQNNNPFFPGELLYAWQAPLYPLSLAALYLFAGPDASIGRLFGVLIGVVTVYFTFDLARRIFSVSPLVQECPPPSPITRDRVAWIAAFLVAVYPGFLTSAHLLLSETLFTFLLVFAFDMIAAAVDSHSTPFLPWKSAQDSASPLAGDSPSLTAGGNDRIYGAKWRAAGRGRMLLIFAAGAVWGAATLTRGITLYFALPLALWLAIDWVSLTRAERRGLTLKCTRPVINVSPTMAIAFVVGMVVVMAPWTIRNFSVFGQFVMLETKGGVNFWLGNSPFTPNDFIRNVWKSGVREPMLAVLPAGEIARDRAGYNEGESFVAREPLTFIARMPVKFADFWGFERNLTDAAEATRLGKAGGWSSPAKIAADFVSDAAYVLLVMAAIAGLVFSRQDSWKVLLGGFVVYFVLAHMVVFGDGRFHLPLVPFLALYAAWFFANFANGVRWRSAQGLTALALALVFTIVWAHEILAAWMELRGVL